MRLLLTWLCVAVAFVPEVLGQTGSLLFDIPTDARTAGLGGQLVSGVSPDLHVASFNPSFLDCEAEGNWAIDYVNYFGSTTIGAVTTAWGGQGPWTFGAGARFATFGELVEYDAAGVPTGNAFSAGDVVLQSSASYVTDWGEGHRVTLGGTAWAGTRTLLRDVAVMAGVDLALRGAMPAKQFSWGLALTGAGGQWGLNGLQPTGRLPWNLLAGCAKSFANAPFTLHLTLNELTTWDLAPPGTYDAVIDPLTGTETQPVAFPFGDALMRHVTLGTELDLSEALALQFGYDYRRRQELRAGDRPGTNGFSLGCAFRVKRTQVRIARNTYHFAGASTHLGVTLDLVQ